MLNFVHMNYVYAPGCALMCYKPRLAERLAEWVTRRYGNAETLLRCCFHTPHLEAGTCILTPCTTCDQRYRRLYPDCETRWLLEEMLGWEDFDFPDYGGEEMTLHDTCSGRSDERYLLTVRRLLERMNIRLREAERSGKKGRCCGQLLYGKQPLEKVEAFMKSRADEMPCEQVVVYCASCIQAMFCGGKQPRFLLDLLFGEPTEWPAVGVDAWNRTLLSFRDAHAKDGGITF